MLILVIDDWCISCEIAIRWISLDFTDDQSTLVQVMAWCCQATSHYLSQRWPRSLSPYGVTRPKRVNKSLVGPHSHLPPTAPPPDLRRPQRVLRHEKLGNSVTWPAWENWNAFLFNWCLYSSEIYHCKSPWPHKCTTIFCFYNPDLPDAIICQSWIWQQ